MQIGLANINMNILNWKESVGVDNSIEKINIYEYEPHQGIDLNEAGHIRITINNQDQFIHPSESHLYLEGELIPKVGNTKYSVTDDISLVSNGYMYLFKEIEYSIADKKIEGYNNPGRATSMKGLLTYPKTYPEGMNFLWSVDDKKDITDNDDFKRRRHYIHAEGNGKFSAMIPLAHIFGFCENYDKVMYGAKHELTLQRTDDDDAIHRSTEKLADGLTDKVKKGKIKLTKISWRMPMIKLSDNKKIELFGDIQKKATIPVEFLSRQCESIHMNTGQRQLDWRLSVATGSERPRYVVVGFQRDKLCRDNANSAVFDNLDVRSARVEYNGEYYPDNELQLDLSNNKYSVAYQMLVDFTHKVLGREGCAVRARDFKTLYTLLVFDISHQSERMKDAPSDIRIKASFNTNIPVNSYAYALVLSDREFKIQADGDRMHIIK